MPKISLSLPGDVLTFIDSLGTNRSKAIVSILQEYQRHRRSDELAKAYDAYAALCADDDAGWWSDWESSAAADVGGETAGDT